MTSRILIAGFGGQGILFAGKFLVNKGMLDGKQVTWLPSYGPEMRGGTANCSVVISDEPVSSPIVDHPDVLMVMNLPSLDKYEDAVAPGGTILVDSTLIDRKVNRADVNVVYVPATYLASENGMTTLANIILTGKLLSVMDWYSEESIETALKHVVSAKHPEMYEMNRKALEIGRNFA